MLDEQYKKTEEHMKKTLETSEQPGRVLTNSRAGRMVCWVVCTAPDTMPSAWPLYTIMVPKALTSVIASRADSGVTPLCLRSSW